MAQDTPGRREQIRKEIRKTSREEFILKEMKRLGYWPDNKDKPEQQEELILRRRELSKEISELSKEHKLYENKEAALNRYKKERLAKSREKQKLNKQKKADEKKVRQIARKREMHKNIDYLGKRYSNQLKKTDSDLEQLAKHNLPKITDIKSLAQLLGITVEELRFLSYDRKLNQVSHYITYGIKKKSGGIRKITAPKPKLKRVQRSILDKLLSKVDINLAAQGFMIGKSIVSNAVPHIGAGIVINMDLKDFFPTISFKRIFGLYKKLGFSPQISTVLALICTIPEEEKLRVHGKEWYLNSEKRYLPQGAPTSPMLTNIICRKLDSRLTGIAKQLGFRYTRYADDMTFSGPTTIRKNINKLKWQVRSVIKDEDFILHPDKTKVMVNGHRKEVTGITVNEVLNVPSKKLKDFRALLYQLEKDGPKDKYWGDPSVNLFESIEGYARFVNMVNPTKGKKLIAQVKSINKKYKPKGIRKQIFKEVKDRAQTKQKSGKPWWKIW